MILEGIVTTVFGAGVINIAPMGPAIDGDMTRFLLRPYPTSQTCQNLLAHGEGVFHITDDVLLMARAAIGPVDPAPPMVRASRVNGWVLTDVCRFYEFQVRAIDASEPRLRLDVEVIHQGRWRDFFGFNRGKHAVIEAAILATRTAFLPAQEIEGELEKLGVIVAKTGGPAEHEAFRLLHDYVHSQARDQKPA